MSKPNRANAAETDEQDAQGKALLQNDALLFYLALDCCTSAVSTAYLGRCCSLIAARGSELPDGHPDKGEDATITISTGLAERALNPVQTGGEIGPAYGPIEPSM
jgi:hypothetical protein